MKLYKTITLFVSVFALLTFAPAFAQMGGGGHMGGGGNWNGGNGNGGNHGDNHMGGDDDHGNGCMVGGDHGNGGWCVDPDSLEQVTVSGTVLAEAGQMMDILFLDVDNDGSADYHLNFGPYWYEPDSSNAVRPAAGDVITVTGGAHESEMWDFEVIIVYEINGEFWRDPFTPLWNDMGGMGGGRHGHGDFGYHFGMGQDDSLETITLSGRALIDSTVMAHYYLDVDGDAMPDYFLNFGPWWYTPESGVERPTNGESITVVGGLAEGEHMNVLIVYELNGQVWRDSTFAGGHMGGWITGDMSGSRRIHSPFDKEDWMEFQPGWRGHGGGMKNLPDSLYCQMWEVLPENIPGAGNGEHMAAWQIDIYASNGGTMMMNGMGRRSHMRFGNQVRFQLHYTDEQMNMFGGDESQIMAHYWDEESKSWKTADAVVDAANNTVTFSGTEVSSFVALSAPQTTTSVARNAAPVDFVLEQNYPNPFNPQTTIAFRLENQAHVTLNIYNVIGQHVATLVDGQLSAGAHQSVWNAADMTTGLYFYELRIGNQSQLKKMNLVK